MHRFSLQNYSNIRSKLKCFGHFIWWLAAGQLHKWAITELKFIFNFYSPAHEYNTCNAIIEHNIVNGDWRAILAEAVFLLTPTYDMYSFFLYTCKNNGEWNSPGYAKGRAIGMKDNNIFIVWSDQVMLWKIIMIQYTFVCMLYVSVLIRICCIILESKLISKTISPSIVRVCHWIWIWW